MISDNISTDVYVQRLDVACSVVERQLRPGSRMTKKDVKILYVAANNFIEAYLRDVKNGVIKYVDNTN